MTKQQNQSWGGRFSGATNEFVQEFNASFTFDRQMFKQDIQGSIAHATMLSRIGVLTENEQNLIINGLKEVQQDIENDNFVWSKELEDVHMHIEAALTEKIGIVGKKLHTGRSRNDQVATDIRLFLRDESNIILKQINILQQNILNLAKANFDTIMPGFTHLQVAQPITFGHHLMAYVAMFERDYARFIDCLKRINISPLGSAALAGTTYQIDRFLTAELLGFSGPCINSLDGVSDRDFAIEFLNCASILMMHFSRFCEELIIWNSQNFKFIDLPDEFCTGSSIMPQKKNPDVPELVRGKSARVFGHLFALLTLMKSQPLAYNKDNQEDKEPLFDTIATVQNCLRAFIDLIPNIKAEKENMQKAANEGFSVATDLADYLVLKGVAFRDSHEITGKIVKFAISQNKTLNDLKLQEYKHICSLIEEDIYEKISLKASVNARDHFGGTNPNQVLKAIAIMQEKINKRNI